MGNLTLALWENFLDGRDEKTRDVYRDGVNYFLQANGFESLVHALSQMKRKKNADELIANFIAFLKEKKLSSNTIRLYVSGVRNLLTLYDIRFNPIKLKSFMPKKRLIRDIKPIPKDLITKVLPLMRQNKRLLVWFLFATGCRVGEALNLRIRDLDLDSDPPRAEVETEKTLEKRIVFIPSDLAKILRDWIKGKDPDSFVFHNERGPQYPLAINHVRAAFQSALKRLEALRRDKSDRGWEYSLHSLRKTFKTVLQNAGMDGLMIELLMGHDVGIDKHYYKPTIEEIAKQWKKYEKHLLLDFGSGNIVPEELIKTATLVSLETVWSALFPNQSPEELYYNRARLLNKELTIDEKIHLLKNAIQNYVSFLRGVEQQKLTEAFREAIEEAKAYRNKRRS
jgi:integrase/recombinase XerC